jgi:hypothetical protein
LIEHAPNGSAPFILGDVGSNPTHLDPMLTPSLLGKRTKTIPPPGNHHKRMPPAGKPKRNLSPNAGRRASDERPPLAGFLVTHSDRTTDGAVVFPK